MTFYRDSLLNELDMAGEPPNNNGKPDDGGDGANSKGNHAGDRKEANAAEIKHPSLLILVPAFRATAVVVEWPTMPALATPFP